MKDNVNFLAIRSYVAALRRGKVRDKTKKEDFLRAIKSEVREYREATNVISAHIPQFSHETEELADIIITCMTTLAHMGVDVGAVLNAKIQYNMNRKD